MNFNRHKTHMKSIIYQLGSDEFTRIRVGIGTPPQGLVDYVLGRFSKEEQVAVAEAGKNAAEAAEMIIKEDVSAAMSHFNGL